MKTQSATLLDVLRKAPSHPAPVEDSKLPSGEPASHPHHELPEYELESIHLERFEPEDEPGEFVPGIDEFDEFEGGPLADDGFWARARLMGSEAGMATAEYAIATLAAVGLAGLLVVILRSEEVRGFLLNLIRTALSLP